MPHNRRHQAPVVAGQQRLDPAAIENQNYESVLCSVPNGCLAPDVVLNPQDKDGVSKVLCNNEQCPFSGYMHRQCFDNWEDGVLAYLKSCGRARSWSEKQRHQNLWTKKGYDLAFKACGCRCGRGHLKKDLDWTNSSKTNDEDNTKRRKKHNKSTKPVLTLTIQTPAIGCHGRSRANSLGSTGSSPPSSGCESPHSPQHYQSVRKRSNPKNEFLTERLRHNSGGNGIFARRTDFSSFNILPKHKINSYHIKMEDEGSQGNDDTRCFLLSSLASARMCRTFCVVCGDALTVYDRYPIIDGTFFIGPRQHSRASVQVRYDNRVQYLSAVCMGCLEGWTVRLRCRRCHQPWDGSHLILGTMYTFDIFAATPCCSERLKCNECDSPVIAPDQRLNFYSDYSHMVSCPFCTALENHFVKALSFYQRVPPTA
ncbi:headcase protein-like [Amphibalanus amphitrite]|uniref:headcase protein-like n=1 Tax=Amphibalanus amphitrite TaxID=1232801 RepID=UPI001C91D907|nr:headcase protein-like [Amphibalanus amphitrite]